MARVEQLINELEEISADCNRRSALQIFNLLKNNKELFLSKLENEDFDPIVKDFESLSNSSDNNSISFKRDYERAWQLLRFHLNRK
jgi:hypothetical protein